MPTISTPNLTLSEADGQVEIRVRYEVTFDAFDRALAELGRNWHSHINVHGFDGGDDLGADIPAAVFDRVDFDVNAGTTAPIPQDVTKTVPRSVLQRGSRREPRRAQSQGSDPLQPERGGVSGGNQRPGGPDQRPLTSRAPCPQAGTGYPRCRPEGTLLVSVDGAWPGFGGQALVGHGGPALCGWRPGPSGSLIGAALAAPADSVRTEQAT